ncbi:FliI/YscN family ATPase [Candidatus Pantoea communis]
MSKLDEWFRQKECLLMEAKPVQIHGRITGVSGILLEASLPDARIGDLCRVMGKDNQEVMAEVVGFNPESTLLSALGQLNGIAQGSPVTPLYQPHKISASEKLLGSVLDGFGWPMDEESVSAFAMDDEHPDATSVLGNAPSATDRPRISEPLATGVRAIDGMITLGIGQRMGLFAGAGCGKTTLLAEIARNTPCDVIVFGLIGERGRELGEFLQHELDDQLRAKTVMVCATSDRTSMERARAAFTATGIAESFRDKGMSVLLIIDSLTRFARAQREIGLALGEPPGRGGLPPSVYTLLPGLLERAGKTTKGAITALYSVLMEADSPNDPVADEVRSLIDGHIILNRKLAEKGHFPAIDILQSLSRTMPNVVESDHMMLARQFRQLMASYQQVEMLIRLGEYQEGNDLMTDVAVQAQPSIAAFLQQENHHPEPFIHMLNKLEETIRAAGL